MKKEKQLKSNQRNKGKQRESTRTSTSYNEEIINEGEIINQRNQREKRVKKNSSYQKVNIE
jgi:hypothetical protein